MSEIKLSDFCAATDQRAKLKLPFTVGESTYATDGRIIIKVPKREGITTGADAPDFSRLNWNHDGVKDWVDIPKISKSQLKRCLICDGCGTTTKCKECYGDGVVGFYNDHHDYTCECQSCNGDGGHPGGPDICTACEGVGATAVSVAIGDALLGSTYLKKIATLPNAKIDGQGTPLGMICFKFDGGIGLLMTRSS